MRYNSQTKILLMLAAISLLAACNKKSDLEAFTEQSTLAVTDFSLKADTKNPGLDSAYFAIDLDHGVIYNPDSLRPGTPINKIIPSISFSSDVESAVIKMEGGTTRTGEVNYKETATDSIDFTGSVTLTLTHGEYQRTYRLKVNVHQQYADSLYWNEAARVQLPSRLPDPRSQKTVALADTTAVALILENDGSYTLSTSKRLFENTWDKKEITLPFTPRLETLAAAGSDLYMLDSTGSLFKGDLDGNWQSTGQVWQSIIGAYLNSAIGLRSVNGHTLFAQYPLTNLIEKEIPSDFPVSGYSDFVTLTNKWTLSPVAFFMGGVTADGTLSPATWAFDGAEWIRLNDGDIPALEQASLIPYYYYRSTTSGKLDEFRVWMLLGGRKADNSINRTVYISLDNGVHWQAGSSLLQLPNIIPDMWGCNNIVASSPKSSNISDNWKIRYRRNGRARLPYEINGDIIRWQCPYIYLIGGTDSEGNLCNSIWRGVLSRLTFVPII